MIRKKMLIVATTILQLACIGQLSCLPALAESPVDINIVELVKGEDGNYRPWEDIVGAMPGMTYSAIPRVRNDGSLPVSVRVCLSESATNSLGKSISLPANTFGIAINNNWVLDNESSTNSTDPASGNCYRYYSTVDTQDITEPLFTEVVLSSKLGNEYQGSTFNLHLTAVAAGDEVPQPTAQNSPSSPDTGLNTASYLATISPVLFSASAVVLFAIIALVLRKLRQK